MTTTESSRRSSGSVCIARKRRCLLVFCLAGCVVAVALFWPWPETLYTVTLLPDLGGKETWPCAINDRGQIAGWAQTPSGAFRLALWDDQRQVHDLGPVVFGLADYPWGGHVHINNKGQIAATEQDPNGSYHAFTRDPNGVRRRLGTLGGHESSAWGLNNLGQVVGWAETTSGDKHAFIWDPTAGMRDLGTLGGAASLAKTVNDAGQIFGLSELRKVSLYPCYWESATAECIRLPSTSFHDMNNEGAVLGRSSSKGSGSTLLWRQGGRTERLFSLDADEYAGRINDANQVIFARPCQGRFWRWRMQVFKRGPWPRVQPYLWDPQRGRIRLDTAVARGLKGRFFAADLNGHGAIVGLIAPRNGPGGRGVLLEPIPERWKK